MTDFLFESKQDAISVLIKDNAEYAELRQTLSKDVSQDFERFKEDIHRFYDIESDMLYIQGFIKLLLF